VNLFVYLFKEADGSAIGRQSEGQTAGSPIFIVSFGDDFCRYFSLFFQRVALLAPIADSAVHGNDVGVAHFLQVVGGQRGAEPTSAIKDERRIEGGTLSLDIALDDAFAEVDGSGEVVGGEFAIFADVDEHELFAAIEAGFDFVNVGLADALLGVFDNSQKARWMLSHGVNVSGEEY
jgi:hypothetical protein